MSRIAFPAGIRIQKFRQKLDGLRGQPFTNIDNETFWRPRLGGVWRVTMDLMFRSEDEYFAVSAFVTAMRGQNTCLLPMVTLFLPNDANGRRLHGFTPELARGAGVVAWASDPFDGFRLRTAAAARHSFLDVDMPLLSRLKPGHKLSLGDRYYEIVGVSAISESETAARISIMPQLRDAFPAGTVVVVDQLGLLAQMEDADELETGGLPRGQVTATFIESFA